MKVEKGRPFGTLEAGKGWLVIIKPHNLEQDIEDLIHGQDIKNWLEEEIWNYRQKNLLKEEEECR